MTPSQYIDAVAIVERNTPAHPLLQVLRTGHSRINEVYLKYAINATATGGAGSSEKVEPTHPVLRELWAERGMLFRQMAKQSNHFHECKTDAERKANSDAILRTWERILSVKGKIAWFETHGELPESEERFPLPDDPGELMKKLLSIRAIISQTQLKLRQLSQLPDDHPDKAVKIAEYEAKLAELKLYRGHAEEKAKREVIHD